MLLHLESGAYHGVNEVGLVIWELLEEEPTFEELVQALRDRVSDAPPGLENDVVSFLTQVQERDLIAVE